MRQLIFVVDDDIEVRTLTQASLEQAGFEVRVFATSSSKLVADAEADPPVLILVALRAATTFALSLCRSIHSSKVAGTLILFWVEIPVVRDLLLAAKSMGADWLIGSFEADELLDRIRALVKRSQKPLSIPHRAVPHLVIDRTAMTIWVRGTELETTSLEFRLIEYLARHRGRVLTRDVLLDAVWGENQFVTPRSVDACVRRIREKIEPNRCSPIYLRTVRGVGYRLDAVAIFEAQPDDATCTLPCNEPMQISESGAKRNQPMESEVLVGGISAGRSALPATVLRTPRG